MAIRKINKEQRRYVCVRNIWTEEKLQEAREYLEAGYYVNGNSDCIGHTLAEMVEREFINIFKKEYGDRIEVVDPDGCESYYIHMK